MKQIVKSNNEYYIKDGEKFFGSFHSVADAQSYLSNKRNKYNYFLNKPLNEYKLIVACI